MKTDSEIRLSVRDDTWSILKLQSKPGGPVMLAEPQCEDVLTGADFCSSRYWITLICDRDFALLQLLLF